ncbi:Imm72 family immunity protein [Vogesella facilis]|uniref:Imm72 family immunity protein n=1 Tax=Vogesella facilis TaxID=1655232 RepID=A0ABV7RC08_9NEIS
MNLQHNRRRLFWLLQKWSSYTVWAHYAKQFDVFVKAYEEALATWPDGERPPEYNVRFAYLAQDLYPKGLAALAKGDRSVWREREDGYLGEAEGASFRAMEGVTSAEINKYDGGERGVPLYTVWTKRLEQLRLLKEAAILQGAEFVYESRPTYANWHPVAYRNSECLPESYFQGMIQEVGPWPEPTPEPPPSTNILVESGECIPNDGIWELVLPHRAPGETDCLNYFVKGAVAPWIKDFEKFSQDPNPGKQYVLPATWRLVWEDTRYLDGVIPDESFYFNPVITPQEPVAAQGMAPPIPSSGRCEAGHPCPQAGTWWTPAKPDGRRAFAQGERMPDFPDSSYGATIWYREAE